jgi:hypothetical protein
MHDQSIVISRDLHMTVAGRKTRGKLLIGNLRKKDKTADLAACWCCSWSLTQVHPDKADVCGEDPLDALQNCLRLVRSLIQNHKDLGYDVWWLEKGDEGGLDWVGASL